MRTDTIFYQLFQTLPSIVFELIGQPPSLAEGYQFASKEVKELARRFDGVFLPPEGDIDSLIYFVEVEFQKKDDFYWRFFTEIFVYLGQYKPAQDWRAIAVFASRSCDPGIPRPYRRFFTEESVGFSPLLQRVYLDELGEPANLSLELAMAKLVVEDEETAVEQARELISKARQEISDAALKQKVVGLIETIMVYKLPQFSHQEIEAMFGLQELKQTRYFQEVRAEAKEEGKLEGKLESVPRLLAIGLTVE
ncbi:MAG TPA: Rpn family recombination-promoting nuclease/putative transposase, partial [Kamptonema sp.]|nr:Rpn family recombination-promoting nuclease/putative transposase [Kamptonema sp.]